ncbi:MAG: DUF305 domain-containing protein [Proteobacteria bacterium]|nr:DUF305 domain-containing protein [Pseudomonadota bacterium]
MHYRKLAIALSINFVAMYFITYAMIDTVDHFHFNINRAWMAMMMVAPMAIVMLVVMRSMFEKRRLNLVLHVAFAALFIACFLFARKQVPIDDSQFLRSMIPHHSSAILMCQEAAITDPEIVKLCEKIIESQKQEIAQMEQILERY